MKSVGDATRLEHGQKRNWKGWRVMNNQDVINFLNQVRKILLDDKSWLESTIQPINEAFDMAISALEKQIPKKPNKIQSQNSENLWNLYCPSCENWIGMWRIGMWNSRLKHVDMHNISNGNICPYCGQAIDWESE